MAKLSVAVTTYNGARYLIQQLCSLRDQTRPPDEVVIVDDCSNDETPSLARAFIEDNALSHWTFSENGENLGYRRNFYKAIAKTTGDLIFLCDQDDVWHPNKLEEMLRQFETNRSILALNTSFDFINAQGQPIQAQRKRGKANHGLIQFPVADAAAVNIPLDAIIRYNISPGCTMAFRAPLREEFLKKSKSVLPHDWEINLYAAMRGGLYFWNTPLIGYRIHASNTIGLKLDKSVQFHMRGSLDVRRQVLAMQAAQADFLAAHDAFETLDKKQRRFVKHLKKFCNARREMLEDRRKRSWFAAVGQLPFLRGVVTIKPRSLIGDLVYLFNLQKHFKAKS